MKIKEFKINHNLSGSIRRGGGGSWNFDASFARPGFRDYVVSGYRYSNLGFRLFDLGFRLV